MGSEMVRKCDGCGKAIDDFVAFTLRTAIHVKKLDCCVKPECAEKVLSSLKIKDAQKELAAHKKRQKELAASKESVAS